MSKLYLSSSLLSASPSSSPQLSQLDSQSVPPSPSSYDYSNLHDIPIIDDSNNVCDKTSINKCTTTTGNDDDNDTANDDNRLLTTVLLCMTVVFLFGDQNLLGNYYSTTPTTTFTATHYSSIIIACSKGVWF
jgi:hypothetical protein